MNAIEHKGNEVLQVNPLAESDPMDIRNFFQRAANAVINASTLREEVQALRDDVQGLRDTVNRLVRERDEMKEERDQARTEANDFRQRLQVERETHGREEAKLNSEVDQRHRNNMALAAERDGLKEQLHHVVQERDSILKERDVMNATLYATSTTLADTERLVELLKKERDDARLAQWQAEDDNRKRSEEVGRLTTEVGTLREQTEHQTRSLNDIKGECEVWRYAAEKANQEASHANAKLTDLSAILAR